MHRDFSLPLQQGSCSFWFFKTIMYYVSLFSDVDQEKQTIYISCWDLGNYHRHDENINKLKPPHKYLHKKLITGVQGRGKTPTRSVSVTSGVFH